MVEQVTRRTFIGSVGVATAALLAGCGGGAGGSAASSGASGQAAAGSSPASAARVVVGTLPTEDILPLWVAREYGLVDAQELDMQIVEFQSATELIAGVASGEVDVAMTDIMVAASMFASGIDVQLEWVTLGADAEQGRFGIMVGPDSDVATLADLAGVPIGVGSNTILEYVLDRLMQAAGVPADQVVVEELQKLPVRYQAMLTGEVAAAALPGSLLALGEAEGCRLIADDTAGDNISQSVMIARADFVHEDGGAAALEALKDVWDLAVADIDVDAEGYRSVLVSEASLPDAVADSYLINEYPRAELPTAEMVDPVLAWMQDKGYLARPVSYDPSTGTFS